MWELPTIGGDPDGIASAINGRNHAIGATGDCGPFNSINQNNLTPLHAVLWQNDKATDLGNLGGDGRLFGIFASGLNDNGDVVGTSDTTGDASFHAFLWHDGHIADLGTVAGDAYSLGVAIDPHGLVLGVSLSASFTPRAALWRDGVAIDMNTLVPTDSALYLESACSTNDKGEIIGFAHPKSNPTNLMPSWRSRWGTAGTETKLSQCAQRRGAGRFRVRLGVQADRADGNPTGRTFL